MAGRVRSSRRPQKWKLASAKVEGRSTGFLENRLRLSYFRPLPKSPAAILALAAVSDQLCCHRRSTIFDQVCRNPDVLSKDRRSTGKGLLSSSSCKGLV